METNFSGPGDEGGGPKPPGETKKVSFKDKLMHDANTCSTTPKKFDDLIEIGKMKVTFVNDNPLLPKVVTDKNVLENMCSPWKDSLVVSLLGKRLGYRTMKAKLASIWRLQGDLDLLDIDNGFFLARFDRVDDKEKVMSGGPWMVFDHYLAVSTWNSDFIPPAAKVRKTLAWIRIASLNVVFL